MNTPYIKITNKVKYFKRGKKKYGLDISYKVEKGFIEIVVKQKRNMNIINSKTALFKHEIEELNLEVLQ